MGGQSSRTYQSVASAHESEADINGAHGKPTWDVKLGTTMGLARSDSWDMVNDPRYFSENVIDKRLAVFSDGGLAVVSGLLLSMVIDQVNDMNKAFSLDTVDGWLQFAAFAIMAALIFCYMLSLYVSVAQLYHTLRLVSAGSLGYDMASMYYLNPRIMFWRHLAIKVTLLSLPLFVVASALRMVFKIDEASRDMTGVLPDRVSHLQARITLPAGGSVTLLGLMACMFFCAQGCCFWCVIHRHHNQIFEEKYAYCKRLQRPLMDRASDTVRRARDQWTFWKSTDV